LIAAFESHRQVPGHTSIDASAEQCSKRGRIPRRFIGTPVSIKTTIADESFGKQLFIAETMVVLPSGDDEVRALWRA